MKKTHYIIVLAFILNSCDNMSLTVDLDLPPHDSQLVVNAVLQAGDDLSKVYVSHSLDPVSLNQYTQIDDASVVLKENNTIIDDLTYQQDPSSGAENTFCYVTEVLLEENKSYQIEVSHASYPTATAQEKIPTPVNIQSVELGALSSYQQACNFTINDPAGIDNYYLLRLKFKEKEMIWGEDPAKWYGLNYESNEPSFEGNDPFDEETQGRKVLFNDQLFDGTNKTFSLNIVYDFFNDFEFEEEIFYVEYEEIDSIKVVLYSVSEAYYNYHQSRRLQNQSDGSAILGAEPVVVYNNIQNGFGIFASKSKDEFSVATE